MSTIKNIAIIAHVDHGKTTLVDKIMYHCQLFRENENTEILFWITMIWSVNVELPLLQKRIG